MQETRPLASDLGSAEPPGYSPPAGHSTEHHCALENPQGHKWLTMYTGSRPKKPESLPLVVEGDTIKGRVELDLMKAETIKSITISVLGSTTFVGQEESLFLNETQSLWVPPLTKGSTKLLGKHTWPFSFTLPQDVVLKDTVGKSSSYRLPPSFTERASPAYIDYKLVVTIKRGAFKVDQTLSVNFGYYPLSIADPPSILRQLVYSEGSPLIGPQGDPEGWKVIAPQKIQGTLFNVKAVELSFSLAIATPLIYAFGSPIPLMATFVGEDTQALDVLAVPSAIRLRLVRSMATGANATEDNSVGRSDNLFYEIEGHAYFWQSKAGAKEPNKRVLQGEIEVGRSLKPSFVFPRFTVRYSVDLLPFVTSGWTDDNIDSSTPLISERINIVTRQAPGVAVRSHAPPGYEKDHRVDYNKSVGLLENGNQRFLPHRHR